MVDAQFQMLSEGAVESAFAFVDPGIVEQYSMDTKRFRSILSSAAFDGLVGCSDWTILKAEELGDDVAVVKLRVLPKPIPGCVRTSGVAAQGGITWPTHYKWQLRRQGEAASAWPGCWMLEQMFPDTPPIDVGSADATPLVEPSK